jgi:uncharacterized protein YbjT (DUF2867 family)
MTAPLIAILGANGQVGSEVALHLVGRLDVRVVAICRTEFATALLRRAGVTCRIGSVTGQDEAERILGDADAVVDFSIPRGLPSHVTSSMTATIRGAIRASHKAKRFIYISSVSAYGMADGTAPFRYHWISRTPYGAAKRHAERLALREAHRAGLEAYILRAGQVHGELQRVSEILLSMADEAPVELPAGPSYTVFAYSIAEAIANITLGRERAGTYTLISSPAWSWEDMYLFYASRNGARPEVTLSPTKPAGLTRALRSCSIGAVEAMAGSIAAYITKHSRPLEMYAAARYANSRTSRDIRALREQQRRKPFIVWSGPIPGRRLRSLSDSKVTMAAPAADLRRRLEAIAPKTVRAERA